MEDYQPGLRADRLSTAMITFFIASKHRYTITPFLTRWPNNVSQRLRLVTYENLHRVHDIRPGLFVFSDIDRLTSTQKGIAAAMHQALAAHFGKDCVLNDPCGVLKRHDFLEALWREGINTHRAYTWAERQGIVKYPVFLRRANDHYGPRSPLLHNPDDLHRQYRRLQRVPRFRNRLIVIEFCDTRDADGLYRKFSAFRIGERIVPGHVIFSEDWVAKDSPPGPCRDEEKAYLEGNPHRALLMRIFRLARIEYGRIDYGLAKGRIQVWEINTNPTLVGEQEKYSEEKRAVRQQLVSGLADAFALAEERALQAAGQTPPLPFHRLAGSCSSWKARLDRQLRPIRL